LTRENKSKLKKKLARYSILEYEYSKYFLIVSINKLPRVKSESSIHKIRSLLKNITTYLLSRNCRDTRHNYYVPGINNTLNNAFIHMLFYMFQKNNTDGYLQMNMDKSVYFTLMECRSLFGSSIPFIKD
jgi:hypothetical protein